MFNEKLLPQKVQSRETVQAQSTSARNSHLVEFFKKITAHSLTDKPNSNSFTENLFTNLSDNDVIATTQALETAGRILDHARVVAAAEIRARQEKSLTQDTQSFSEKFGHKNETELLQRLTLSSRKTVTARLSLAEAIYAVTNSLTATNNSSTVASNSPTAITSTPTFATVAKGLETGLLPIDTAEQIVKDLSKVADVVDPDIHKTAEIALVSTAIGGKNTTPTDSQFDVVEDVLQNGTTRLPETSDKVRTISKILTTQLKQQVFPENNKTNLAARFLHIGKESGGLIPISGRVTKETAALIGRIMDAMLSPRATKTKTKQLDLKDERTAAQKRHDAFVTILQVAANSKDIPQLGGAPVTVMIQVNEKDLKNKNSQSAGLLHGYDGKLTPISRDAIEHAGCAGAIQKIVLNDEGKIVQLGNKERIFNSHQRKAIILRDGGCVIPGCDTPATWCEIHHVQEHSKGGKTHTDNGVTLCWYHHRSLDNSGWQVRMQNGVPWIRPPKWLATKQRWQKHEPPNRLMRLKTPANHPLLGVAQFSKHAPKT